MAYQRLQVTLRISASIQIDRSHARVHRPCQTDPSASRVGNRATFTPLTASRGWSQSGGCRLPPMSKTHSVDRRGFLKSAAVTGAAAGAAALVPGAAPAAAQSAAPATATAPTPPRETDPAAAADVLTTDRPGGDFMVDVLKSLDF